MKSYKKDVVNMNIIKTTETCPLCGASLNLFGKHYYCSECRFTKVLGDKNVRSKES